MKLTALLRSLAIALVCIAPTFASTPWLDQGNLLLSNASATGGTVEWQGGAGVFAAGGTFGGATVTLEFLLPDGATYIAAGAATTLTAAGAGYFILPHCFVKAFVTGGSPSGLYAAVSRASN